jgi:hypothetical protein
MKEHMGLLNMPTRLTSGAICILGMSLFAGHAGAVPDTFEYIATPVPGNPAISAGVILQYDLLLQETTSGTSLLVPSRENGVFGAGVKVTPTVANASSKILGIASDGTDFGPNGLLATSAGSDGSSLMAETLPITGQSPAGVLEGNHGGGTVVDAATPANDVFMGILSILVGAGTTTFSLGVYDAHAGFSVTFNNGYDLDHGVGPLGPFTPIGTTVTSFTISTPEPAALSLLAAGAAAVLLRRRRRA